MNCMPSQWRYVRPALFAALLDLLSGLLFSQNSMSDAAEEVARGELLVTVGGCGDCHTPKIMGPNGPKADPNRILAGAPADLKLPPIPPGSITPTGWGALASADLTTWAGPWGVSFASNLTPDKETGMGSWTEAAFIKTMRSGKHKGVLRPILPPMPWENLSKVSDPDLKAMFAYLRSLKPVRNKVPDPVPPGR